MWQSNYSAPAAAGGDALEQVDLLAPGLLPGGIDGEVGSLGELAEMVSGRRCRAGYARRDRGVVLREGAAAWLQ
jgi:hypothetical protein